MRLSAQRGTAQVPRTARRESAPLQKPGLGGRLLDAAEDDCRTQACAVVDVDVVSLRTELLPLYEGRGLRRTKTMPFDDPRLKQPAHLVRMSKALSPRS